MSRSDRRLMVTIALVSLTWMATHETSMLFFHRFTGRLAADCGLDGAAQHQLQLAAATSSSMVASHAQDLVALGAYYRRTGRLEEAKRELEKALEAAPIDVRAGRALRSKTLAELNVVYEQLGLLGQALSSAEALLAIAEDTSDEGRLAVADVLERLAAIHRLRHTLAPAVDHQQRALSIREANLGYQHPAVAVSMSRLGVLIAEQGNLDWAERSRSCETRTIGQGGDGWPASGWTSCISPSCS